MTDYSFCRVTRKIGKILIDKKTVPPEYGTVYVDSAFPFHHNGKIMMTVLLYDGKGYQTALFESENYIDWKFVQIIFGRNPEKPHLRWNAAITSILRDHQLFGPGTLKKVDGYYIAAYTSYPLPGYEAGAGRIGLARSRDLLSWEPDDGILFPEDGEEWEQGGLYKTCLLEINGTYYLYYNAKRKEAPNKEQTGFAVSKDLKVWTRSGKNPVIGNQICGEFTNFFASDPQVFEHNGKYYCFFFGNSTVPEYRTCELVASSDDLVHWNAWEERLITHGERGSVDDIHAHKPGILTGPDGILYHYYTAVNSKNERGIALAVTDPE